MTVLSPSDIAEIRIDRDQDIIPISVGLYKLFLAGGSTGREAMDLYIHLIFTARLQATQQVRANNTYLARGLGWGIAKVKAAKAWLAEAKIIEYVRPRGDGGQLGQVYIRLQFLPRAETLAARLATVGGEPAPAEPAPAETYRDDLTPDLFRDDCQPQAPEEGASDLDDAVGSYSTTGSDSEPVVTTGSIHHPVVDHAHGPEQQMLKANNEMLEVKKGKGPAPAGRPVIRIETEETPPAPPHHELVERWFRRFSSETSMLVSPRADDYKQGRELFDALGGRLDDLQAALDMYFCQYRQLWYAVSRATQRLPDAQKKPEWSFRSFCTRYTEIVLAAKNASAGPADSTATVESAAAPTKFGYLFRGEGAAV